MWHVLEVSVPREKTDQLLAVLHRLDGLSRPRVRRCPNRGQDDVVQARVSPAASPALARVLAEHGVAHTARLRPSDRAPAARSPRVLAWEEMEATVERESRMSRYNLVLMAVAGVFAAVGLATNALHYLIAAMLIGPGYAPLAYIALGAAARRATWRRGARDFIAGYATLIGAAAATGLALQLEGNVPLGSQPSYLGAHALIAYWAHSSASGLIMDLFGGAAAGVLVATGRSILTAGAMIGLALVPSAALVGVAIAGGRGALAATGLLHWAIKAALVLLASLLVFAAQRRAQTLR